MKASISQQEQLPFFFSVKLLLPRWDNNISVFTNKMKPFCTLGHGRTSFSVSAQRHSHPAQLCPSHEGLPLTLLLREHSCEHSCLSLGQICFYPPFLQTHENQSYSASTQEIPSAFTSWLFVRCISTGWLHSSLSLFTSLYFFFLQVKGVWQLKDVFVFMGRIFLSFVLSFWNHCLTSTKRKKYSQYCQSSKLRNFLGFFLLMLQTLSP